MQTRSPYQQVLPPLVYETFEALCSELLSLHMIWNELRLLCDSQENVSLLNEVASGFFGQYQKITIDNIILIFSRMSDPATTGSNSNITFETLFNALWSHNSPRDTSILVTELRQLLDNRKSDITAMREHRNKSIAHNDTDTILERRTVPLSVIDADLIERTLSTYREILNKVESWYIGGTTDFISLRNPYGSATLLRYLKDTKKQ